MTIHVSTFKVLATGVDGGHKYIETELFHSGQLRKLTALFKNKSEEAKIQTGVTLTLSGKLQDDGSEYGLLLLDTEII
ncbi:hypothetical protein [Flavisolibacter nicotianae]|uniref:hypothetical protein n=1 Tax=Flavisolibacter nicotianae TaxID=2364882 RepID=UPI000EAB9361|nr:hypothetical protein [Flavisolibacter nicotianae]